MAPPPAAITSRATAPASGFPEMPEKASEPPHCRAMFSADSGSSLRRASAAARSNGSTASSSTGSPAVAATIGIRSSPRARAAEQAVTSDQRMAPAG